jgi:hypothetical protein
MMPVVFPDVELWATGWLRSALTARAEPYAADVFVSNARPSAEAWTSAHPSIPYPARMVTVRRDGGPRLDVVREAARLGVNVWGKTEQEASDLARLVRALLWSAPDGDPVCKVTETSGPSPIPDVQPRRYMTFELVVRGTDL